MASGTINGTVSRNSSKFNFYVTWTSTKEDANKRHKIVIKTYLHTTNTAYDFEQGYARNHWIICNGVTINLSRMIDCNPWPSNPFLIQTGTFYVAYRDPGVKQVSIDAFADCEASIYGADNCNIAATTISLDSVPETGTLAAAVQNEASCKATLSGITSNVSFSRTIKWYYKLSAAASYILFASTTVAAGSTVTTYDKTYTGLTPGQAYIFKADICKTSDGSVLLSKTITKSQSAALVTFYMSNKTADSIKANLIDLLASPGYTRTAYWYYKKSSVTSWTAAGSTIIANGTNSAVKVFTGMLSETYYDFKCELADANGLVYSVKTEVNVNFPLLFQNLPVAAISRIEQLPFSDTIRVYWTANDPADTARFQLYGLFYDIEPAAWVAVGGLLGAVPAAYSVFTNISAGRCDFRIKTTNTSVSGEVTGDSYRFTVEDSVFAFSPVPVSGGALLSAAEWNRFRAWALVKFDVINLTLTEAEQVEYDKIFAAGNIITAEHFNLIGSGLGSSVPAKAPGNAALVADFLQFAAELNALVEL